MRLVITCDCGEEEKLELNSGRGTIQDGVQIKLAAEEWQREHLRMHNKLGDYDEHHFTSEVELW